MSFIQIQIHKGFGRIFKNISILICYMVCRKKWLLLITTDVDKPFNSRTLCLLKRFFENALRCFWIVMIFQVLSQRVSISSLTTQEVLDFNCLFSYLYILIRKCKIVTLFIYVRTLGVINADRNLECFQ